MNWTIIKEHLVSGAIVFLGTFVSVACWAIATSKTIEWTSTFWVGILISGVTAGLKELAIRYAPKTSGKLGVKR